MQLTARQIESKRHAAISRPPWRIGKLLEYGQSYWLDNLTRQMIEDGELRRRVDQESLRGVTSNPDIFNRSIARGVEYDDQIAKANTVTRSTESIYTELVIADVRNACDILRPAYDESQGLDGFVSLEVSPRLAHSSAASIIEAQSLAMAVGRPNLFIKIPGTVEGISAIEELLFQGVNINITLLFSTARYESVAEAYLRALERRVRAGKPVNNVTSVASFFLSRVDVLVDELLGRFLDQSAIPRNALRAERLLGKVAVANAKLAYLSFQHLLDSVRWKDLERDGARPQRLLWASTGAKNPRYNDLMYVEPLIGMHTINTMPDKTIYAFNDHGRLADTIHQDTAQARQVLDEIDGLGIDFAHVAKQLEDQGIRKFVDAFDASLAMIDAKRSRVASSKGG
jgi:transaldolase